MLLEVRGRVCDQFFVLHEGIGSDSSQSSVPHVSEIVHLERVQFVHRERRLRHDP
jgi:hypothetical protein